MDNAWEIEWVVLTVFDLVRRKEPKKGTRMAATKVAEKVPLTGLQWDVATENV